MGRHGTFALAELCLWVVWDAALGAGYPALRLGAKKLAQRDAVRLAVVARIDSPS